MTARPQPVRLADPVVPLEAACTAMQEAGPAAPPRPVDVLRSIWTATEPLLKVMPNPAAGAASMQFDSE